MKFEILNLHSDILKGVADAGFERCTPIQEQALPDCVEGKDIIAQSQTGTGKTAVFVLTIMNHFARGDGHPGSRPRALVMVPTRELAVQVEQDAVKLSRHLPFKTLAVYGGVEYDRQVSALKTGVDLVVATPGRMIDLYKSKTLSLDDIEIFVIDEADRMFDMGFAPDITYIASHLPKEKPRQTMLFSATIDTNVERLAARYMKKDTTRVEIEPDQITVDAIDQKVIYVSNEEKLPVLMGLLKRPDAESVIIFTNMKRTAEMLEFKLKGNGFHAMALTGDMSQSKRQKVMEGMKSGKVKILVATDVAARGLHIEGVTHVVNYDLPEEPANYVHRVGRTARAGKSGKAYSLVCESYAFNLPDIEKYIDRKIESEWIDDADMVADAAGRFFGSRGAGPGGRAKRTDRSGGRSSEKPAGGRPSGRSGGRSSAKPQERPSGDVAGTAPSEQSRTRPPEKDMSGRPGRIVRPERVGKPRPKPLSAREEREIEARMASTETSEQGETPSAPRRRRRRRRPSGGKGRPAEGEKQAQPSGTEGDTARKSSGARPEGSGEAPASGAPRRRRRRRPSGGRGRGAGRPAPGEGRASHGKDGEAGGANASASKDGVQEKVNRYMRARSKSPVAQPAPAPETAPEKPKSGGFLKKFLGVFKKKS